MKRGILWQITVVCIYCLCFQMNAIAEWKGCLPDQEFDKILEKYKIDPGALANNSDILRKISTKQMEKTIAELGTTQFTYLYPIQIKGEELKGLKGKNTKILSIMAVKGGRLVPIPYQIDEFDESGLIYLKDISPYKPDGRIGVLDMDDEIVFMYRDAGLEPYNVSAMNPVDGTILREIRLDSQQNAPRYAYVVEGNCLRSEADYVHANLKSGSVETAHIKIMCNPKNFTEVKEISTKIGPYYGQNAVDNFYVKMSTGLINEHLRFEMNSMDNIHLIPLGVKDGPVRATILFKARIWYFGMPTPFKDYININFYEQAANVPSRFTLDTITSLRYFLKIIKRPEVEITVDFHNLKGAKFMVQNVYDPTKADNLAVVDNHISSIERRIVASRLPGEWVYFDSNQGWNAFFTNQMYIEPGGLIDEYLEGMEVHLIYEDNLDSIKKYEKYPGAEPRIGVTTSGIPTQATNVLASLKNMDFKNIETVGELFFELDRIGKRGDLKKLDAMSNKVIARMKKKGTIKTKSDFIKIALQDFKVFTFKGVDPDKFTNIIEKALDMQLNDNIDNFDHGKIVHNIIELSKKEGVDINKLRYAVTDSTVWLPGSLGDGGPQKFHWETKHPPKPTVVPFESKQLTKN